MVSKLAKPARAKLHSNVSCEKQSLWAILSRIFLIFFYKSYSAFSKLQTLASVLGSLVTVC